MPESKRVLIIGLDGATWDVLGPWTADGSLPNLARLRQNGSWGELLSTIPPISAPAWSTFSTGKRPGKHSVFHFVDLFGDDGTQQDKPHIVNARSLKSPTLWDIMGHHGRKVALINLPMTYPPRPVNGFMITGLLTPRNATTFTYPPELSNEITNYVIDLDRFIATKPFQTARNRTVVTPTPALVEEFQDMLERRARTSLKFMASRPWDVFTIVFSGTDRMGHYLWPYHRTADPNDPPETQELCRAVHRYYVRLDEVVGDLVQTAGEDVTVIVMSDHGMGPVNTKRFHCSVWLQQQGWLAAKPARSRITDPDGWFRRLGLPRDHIGRAVKRLPRLMDRRLVKSAKKLPSVAVDVDRSQAYCVPVWRTVTGIRINLKGEEKWALRQNIVGELNKVIDPGTGEPFVKQVYLREDYYVGPYAENIPDIIVSLNPDYECSYRLGHYSSVVTPIQVLSGQGCHRFEGIFAASGPEVMPNPEPLTGMAIEDVAPTVLYLMGLPVPTDMDGRVLTEILKPDTLASWPIRRGDPVGLWPNAEEAVFHDETISGEDEEWIRKRLEALGYLD